MGESVRWEDFQPYTTHQQENWAKLTMTVFDNRERMDESPLGLNQSIFVFVESNGGRRGQAVRDFINRCAANYSKDDFESINNRLRSNDDGQYHSTVFELLLHEILLSKGCKITVEPAMENGTRPDFMAVCPDGQAFILEAVYTSQFEENRMKLSVYDYLNRHPHKNFKIGLHEEGMPKEQPSSTNLCQTIHTWLDGLNPDDYRDRNTEYAKTSINIDGWQLTFTAIPLQANERGRSKSLIGTGPITLADERKRIQSAINEKQRKYGILQMPFIIALHFNGIGGTPEKIMDVLIRRLGTVRSQVSAIWIFTGLNTITPPMGNHGLWRNPDAACPADEFFAFIPELRSENDKFSLTGGTPIRQLLGLPESWPD